MAVTWRVGPGVRADLVFYTGKNLNGKRQQVQLFPSGARRGSVDGGAVHSMVIRAFAGTRVILAASDSDDWEKAAWRCIRVLEGTAMRSKMRYGMPGVRLPDIDMLDEVDAKKTATDFQSSYTYVDSLADGEGWTFGRAGGLKNRIAMISIEREDDVGRVLTPGEVVARAMLSELREHHPEAVAGALDAAAGSLTSLLEGADAAQRVEALREWAAGS